MARRWPCSATASGRGDSAADPGIIGKTISLSGDPFVIIGVIGPEFDIAEFGQEPDLFIPFQLDPNTVDQGHFFQAAARIKPDVTLEQAQARLKLSANEFRAKFPQALQENNSFSVERLQQVFVRNARPTLLILSAAVAFVLLIACANVANLLLVRATARRREVALRAAIGAGRGRIIRQLLTESVALSVIGGAIGLVLGILGIRALLTINTAGLPRIGEQGALVGVDWRVLAFTAAISVVTGIVFGLMPALQSSRADLNRTLKDSIGQSGATFRHNKARSILVVVEVALALLLLVGSALLIRTLVNLRNVNPGFDPSNVLTMRMSLAGQKYVKTAGVEQLMRDGIERLQAIPGVERASATCCVPLEGGYGLPFRILGRPLEKGPFHGGGAWLTVSSGYFDVFKIPITRGRAFTDRDDSLAPAVVIINEAMAKQYWKDGDPLNDRILIGAGVMKELNEERERQIIGVASDVRDGGLNNDPGPHMYVPNAQVPDALNALNVRITPVAWVVRTRGEPYALQHGDPGAVAAVERTAGFGSAKHGGSGLSLDLAPAIQRPVDDGVWRLCAVARSHRDLRTDGVLRRAAHARDRHSNGARCRGRAGPEDGGLPGNASGRDRGRSGSRGCVCVDAADGELPLWRPGARPGRVRRDAGAADGGVDRCRVVSGSPREHGESADRLALRVKSRQVKRAGPAPRCRRPGLVL